MLNPRSPWYLPMAALALVLGLAWIGLAAAPGSAGQPSPGAAPQVGFAAPDFSLETLDGERIALSDLRGRPVLLNFWASWCGPCRAEMPAIQRVYERLSPEGAVVLAVNVTAQDSREAAQAFAGAHALTFPILLDTSGEVARLYQNRALPSSFFIDTQGIIREIVIGGPMAEALVAIRMESLFPGGR